MDAKNFQVDLPGSSGKKNMVIEGNCLSIADGCLKVLAGKNNLTAAVFSPGNWISAHEVVTKEKGTP